MNCSKDTFTELNPLSRLQPTNNWLTWWTAYLILKQKDCHAQQIYKKLFLKTGDIGLVWIKYGLLIDLF